MSGYGQVRQAEEVHGGVHIDQERTVHYAQRDRAVRGQHTEEIQACRDSHFVGIRGDRIRGPHRIVDCFGDATGVYLEYSSATDIESAGDIDIQTEADARREHTALDHGAARDADRSEATEIQRPVEPELQPLNADLEVEIGGDRECAGDGQIAVHGNDEIGSGRAFEPAT